MSPDAWTNAGNCSTEEGGFDFDIEKHPDVSRLIRWKDEQNAFVHGFWYDWADCYGSILDIYQEGEQKSTFDMQTRRRRKRCSMDGCQYFAELDVPGEYVAFEPLVSLMNSMKTYLALRTRVQILHRQYQQTSLLPPKGKSLNTSTVNLMYQLRRS